MKNDDDLWMPINSAYPPPNLVRIELASIREQLYWDDEIEWQTTGIFKNNKLYSIKYVPEMGDEKSVIFKAKPNHWRKVKVRGLDSARKIIYDE